MKRNRWLQNIRKARVRLFGCRTVSLALCVCILVAAVAFALPVIALTHPAVAESQTEGREAVTPVEEARAEEKEEAAGTITRQAGKSRELAATATGEYVTRLTDRSNDIGVVSEGYTDSPYNQTITINKGPEVDFGMSDDKTAGGTFLLSNNTASFSVYSSAYTDEQFWDGTGPFRITKTGDGTRELMFATYDDCSLKDCAPNGAFKIDSLSLTLASGTILGLGGLSEKSFYARGNKFVIGENVSTQSNKEWRIYGGADQAQDLAFFHSTGVPKDVLTNVVVSSGTWNYVFGGGRGSAGRGTQVTIRDDAVVSNVYGGEYMCKIGVLDKGEDTDDRINVYIEGGTVDNLWGGNRVNSYSIDILKGKQGLSINRDININISGGNVTRLIAGSDCTDSSTNTTDNLADSAIHGKATVNITGGSVGSALGDPNRKSSVGRQIQDGTELNLSASNAFAYFDLFDVVNITGDGSTANGVVVSTDSKAGESFSETSSLTFWDTGSTHDGYIGQISVTDGAKLVLKKGGTINKEQNTGTGAWIGETDEAERSMSTLAIKGGVGGAGISAASGTSFIDGTNVCGLRVHGNVEGYSTLEVDDTPIYSDGTNYYYYVVADSSENGGKAFKEPEGANYIVCYRTLDGGKIGWYLRERPTISVNNELVRAGETGEVVLSVTMNSFGYEWSDSASVNRVDFQIVKNAGTDTEESISLSTMAGIKTNTSGRFKSYVTTITDGVEHLVSFEYIIDNSEADNPTYYTVEADYHVVGDSYDDVRTAAATDAARCVYAFDDAVMTAFPYSSSPVGSDTATLSVSLPSGVSGTLAAAEDDGTFGSPKTVRSTLSRFRATL